MVSSLKMTPWLMAIFCLVTAGCTNITDQQTSESQRSDQIAILKQLRKVNDDGSYSFGYEAGDGSFKVESRDVLGNVKGTFGFVDANGDIKRVKYSSSNGTGFKSTTVTPFQQDHLSVVQSIPRVNRTNLSSSSSSSSTSTASSSTSSTTSTTRKPTLSSLYGSSPRPVTSSSTSSYVQAIPRHQSRKTTSSSTTSTPTTLSTSPSKNRPRFYLTNQHNHRRRLIQDDVDDDVKQPETNEEQQITRPEKLSNYRRILFANKRPINLRPITEEFDDKTFDDVKLKPTTTTTTNTLMRRQLEDDVKKSSEIIENDEESDVYGSSSLSTTRPLFTTTTTTLNPRFLINRRSPLFRGQSKPLNFDNNRFYEVEETKDEDSSREQILVKEGQILRRNPVGNAEYNVETEQPVYVTKTPETYSRNVFTMTNNNEDVNVNEDPRSVNYNTESTITEQPILKTMPTIYRDDYYPPRVSVLPPLTPLLGLPLSRRDFQVLLKRLILSRYNDMDIYPRKSYREPEETYQARQSYWPYQQNPPGMMLRQGHIYDNRLQDDRNHYNHLPPRRYNDEDYERDDYQHKRVYRRQKLYSPDIDYEGYDDILPVHIREAILLRMLQLAISPNIHHLPDTTNTFSPLSSTNIYRKNGPVRSVQIINDDENLSMTNKN